MSGLAGLWNLDGRPVDEVVISAMSAALVDRGRDGTCTRKVGALGFSHQHHWSVPEEIGEIQPLCDPAGVMLMLDGRLDNREELRGALDLPRAASDAQYILAAYRRWSDACVARLNGDFTLAIFDPRCQRLLLARDAIGVRPLYYTSGNHFFAFATEIKALLAHPEIEARPDDEGIADYLLAPSRPIDRQEITCFAGISAVIPAHLVLVDRTGMRTERYWDFDPGRTLNLRSFEEYRDAHRERFAEAVRRRARSSHPVAVSVSGGLDSSSIFCQAETLRRDGRVECPQVIGISHFGEPGTAADERRYVQAIETSYGVAIDGFPVDVVGGFARDLLAQIATNEAPLFDYMWVATSEVHRRAVRNGARVLLSGAWGDQILFSSAYLVDLFRRFNWLRIRRHLREYAAWFGPSEARVLARRLPVEIARHHFPRRVVQPLKWVRRRILGVDRARPWLSRQFLKRSLRYANRPALVGSGFHSAQARAVYLEARSKYHVHCMEWQNKAAARSGLDAAFPFLDRDLLAFLMAVPGEVQAPDGVPRGLAREAMRGILPEAIRTRPSKADFTGFVNRGVAADAVTIARTLDRGSLGLSLGYFDAGQLVPAVRRLSRGLSNDNCRDTWDLADTFGLEVWLQVFLSRRGEPVPHSRAVTS
jgi:asparagine synthase (glutamine-hydrolysing)